MAAMITRQLDVVWLERRTARIKVEAIERLVDERSADIWRGGSA